MPAPRPRHEVGNLWQAFVRGLRSLMSGLPEHRFQDQYLGIKDAALDLAESGAMKDEIERAYEEAAGTPNAPKREGDAVEIVAMEIEAFPRAMAVYDSEAKAGTARPGAYKWLRTAAKTTLGSIKDLFKLSDYGKGVITVLEEALGLTGKD